MSLISVLLYVVVRKLSAWSVHVGVNLCVCGSCNLATCLDMLA